MFDQPTNVQIPVWRYVTLAKLIALLQQRSLWLSRADLLGDPHEGATGLASLRLREQTIKSSRFQFVREAELEPWFADLTARSQAWTGHVYVNCWHMNEVESMAMWQVYGGGAAPVAIRSTFQRLRDSLAGNYEAFIGEVQYVDPDIAPAHSRHLLEPFLRKRLAFAHEREVRVVRRHIPDPGAFDLFTPGPPGVVEPIDTETLIEAVVLGPNQPDWYRRVVEGTVRAFAPGIVVETSSLDVDPVW